MTTAVQALEYGLQLLQRRSSDARLLVEFGGFDDYRLVIQQQDGAFSANLLALDDRIQLSTIPRETRHLAGIAACGLAEQIRSSLLGSINATELAVTRLSYSITSQWALGSFSADRRQRAQSQARLFRPARDGELHDLVRSACTSALAWQPPRDRHECVSLWFYPEPERIAAIYANIRPNGNRYDVDIEDRVCWPWKEVTGRAASHQAAADTVADFIEKHHRFAFTQLSACYFYSAYQMPVDKKRVKELDGAIAMSRLGLKRHGWLL